MYKMQTASGNFERGDSGAGKIRFSTDGLKVQVLLKVRVGEDTFDEKKYLLDIKEDCPENIGLVRDSGIKEWKISMNKEGNKLLSFHPLNGHFSFKTKEFASAKDADPAPKEKIGKARTGHEYTYSIFTVFLDIVKPENLRGITVPLVLRYRFAETIVDGKSVVCFSMGGKYTDELKEYMIASGCLEDKYHPMPYKDNILPDLQRIALYENREFEATIKDGWIIPGSLIASDPDEDEMPFDVDEVTEIESSTPEFEEKVTGFGDEIPFGDFEPDELEFE
jgi:hypothetical protein